MSKFSNKDKNEVPKDYFVKFGEKILDKTSEEEIFNAADFPIVGSIEKNKDFSTPNQYFENFESKAGKTKSKSFPLYRILGIAATILLCAFLFTLGTKENFPEKENLVSNDNLDVYLEDVDAIELSEIFELQELMSDEKEDDSLLQHVEDEILIEYLLEESDAYDLAIIY